MQKEGLHASRGVEREEEFIISYDKEKTHLHHERHRGARVQRREQHALDRLPQHLGKLRLLGPRLAAAGLPDHFYDGAFRVLFSGPRGGGAVDGGEHRAAVLRPLGGAVGALQQAALAEQRAGGGGGVGGEGAG